MFSKLRNKVAQSKCNHSFNFPEIVSKFPHKARYDCRKCDHSEIRTLTDKELEELEKSSWVTGLESLSKY